MISFDWPSDNEKPDYPGDHNNAEKSGPLLITRYQHHHSMGGYVLQNAFSKVAQEPIVNQVMLVQADVLNLAFDDARNFPPTSALDCFTSNLVRLTVYWSGKDRALQSAQLEDVKFVGPCGRDSYKPKAQEKSRLGFVGLSSETLSNHLNFSNVNCTSYYDSIYVDACPHPPPPSAQDSHVWPLLRTTCYQQPACDPNFIYDVYQIIKGLQRISSTGNP